LNLLNPQKSPCLNFCVYGIIFIFILIFIYKFCEYFIFIHLFSYLAIFYSFIYQNLICLFFYLIDTGKLRVRAAADGEGAAVQPLVRAGEQLRATRLHHAPGKLPSKRVISSLIYNFVIILKKI
jgi:hypothetical protein